MAKENTRKKPNRGPLDFEARLWAAADKMRGHMDASEYKHGCLGLNFLKYISDAFEEKRGQLLFGFSDPKSEWFIKNEPQRAETAENRDEYHLRRNYYLCPLFNPDFLEVTEHQRPIPETSHRLRNGAGTQSTRCQVHASRRR